MIIVYPISLKYDVYHVGILENTMFISLTLLHVWRQYSLTIEQRKICLPRVWSCYCLVLFGCTFVWTKPELYIWDKCIDHTTDFHSVVCQDKVK
jgi:hypothetical protein